jgi:ABC-type oligopeptide transport system substrate-binding subunit
LAYHNSFAFDKAQQAYEEGFTLRRQAGQRVASWRAVGQWRHEQYEQLVEEARRLSSHAERMQRYRQAEEILVAEAPIVPLGYGRIHFLVKPWVKKIPTTPLHVPIWKDAIIEPH